MNCIEVLEVNCIVCSQNVRGMETRIYLTIILRNRAEYRLILSRRGRRPSWLKSLMTIFRKIEQDNCFIIKQTVNETDFLARKIFVVRRFARFRTNLGNLRISQDMCYVRMTNNDDFLTIYGHRANLLNK